MNFVTLSLSTHQMMTSQKRSSPIKVYSTLSAYHFSSLQGRPKRLGFHCAMLTSHVQIIFVYLYIYNPFLYVPFYAHTEGMRNVQCHGFGCTQIRHLKEPDKIHARDGTKQEHYLEKTSLTGELQPNRLKSIKLM